MTKYSSYSNRENKIGSSLDSAGILEVFFKEFYYELLKCKEKALRTGKLDKELDQQNDKEVVEKEEEAKIDDLTPASIISENEVASVHSVRVVTEIQETLKDIFKNQSEEIMHLLDQVDTLQFKEAQYAMVSLADEIFLNLPWQGQKTWQKVLLEGELFQSQSAGSMIFQRIDTLLERYDPSRISVAKIYSSILTLGFKGKYNDTESQSIIKNYERKLYAYTFGKNPSIIQYSINGLMPACYENTENFNTQAKLPDVKFWSKLIAGLFLVFLFISYIIWYSVAKDLNTSIEYIFEQFQTFLSGNKF